MSAYVYTGGKPHRVGQPTMLFIHGAANDHSVWALQSRFFAHHGWNVIAPDLPAHGRTAGDALQSVEAISAWCEKVLDSYGAKSAKDESADSPRPAGEGRGVGEIATPQKLTIIGHSMGALAALNLAACLGERCTHLALLGAAAPMAVGDGLLDAARNEPDRAYRMICQWSYSPASHIGGNKSPGMWKAGAGLALMRRTRAGVLHQDLLNCRNYANALEDAQQLKAKTLMIAGAKDLMTPVKAGAELANTLAIKPVVLKDCGHTMMSERPDEVLHALSNFLS